MPTIVEHVHSTNPSNIHQLGSAILTAIAIEKVEHPERPIVLVSGKVTGKNSIETRSNELRLIETARRYQKHHPEKTVFTSGQIMTEELRTRIKDTGATYEDFVAMWGFIATFVDELIMARGWQKSTGASEEHRIATMRDIPIHHKSRLDTAWINLSSRRKIRSALTAQ